MDLLILRFAAFLVKYRIRFHRLLLSALFGAFYAIAVLFIGSWSEGLPVKLIASALMIQIAYAPRTVNDFFRLIASFYLFSFIFGGAVFGLNYLLYGRMAEGLYVDQSVRPFILGVAVAVFIAEPLIRRHRQSTAITVVEAVIRLNGESVPLVALVDTGNTLREPVSHEPVTVVYEPLLDPALTVSTPYFLLPCATALCPNGILKCVRAESITLHTKESRVIDSAYIALCPTPLSSDGAYSALLPPDYFSNGG